MTGQRHGPNTAQRLSLALFIALVAVVGAIGAVILARAPAPIDIAAVASGSPSRLDTPTLISSTPPVSAVASASAAADSTPSRRPRRSRPPTSTAPASEAPATTPPTPSFPVDETLDASLTRCPTAAEIAFVNSRLEMTFRNDPTAPDLVCRVADGSADLTRLQERGYQGVLAMRRIPFDEPLEWTDRPLLGWFTRAVDGIIFDGESPVSYCCENDSIVLRSDPEMGHLQTVNVWNSDGGGGLIGLVALMLHEARHNEGYLHDCDASVSQTMGLVDDSTIEQLGSWGVQYYFAKALAEDTSSLYMTPANEAEDFYRMSAAESMEFIARYRICDPPG